MIDDPISMNKRLFESVAELGKLLGLSKSASLVLALLCTQSEPLSLDEAAHKTGIAKSSISVILKTLEQMGLAQEVGRLGDRRKLYQATENLPDVVATLIARRLDSIATRQQDALALCAAQCATDQRRLSQLQAIYNGLVLLASFFRARRADAWQEIQDRLAVKTPPS